MGTGMARPAEERKVTMISKMNRKQMVMMQSAGITMTMRSVRAIETAEVVSIGGEREMRNTLIGEETVTEMDTGNVRNGRKRAPKTGTARIAVEGRNEGTIRRAGNQGRTGKMTSIGVMTATGERRSIRAAETIEERMGGESKAIEKEYTGERRSTGAVGKREEGPMGMGKASTVGVSADECNESSVMQCK